MYHHPVLDYLQDSYDPVLTLELIEEIETTLEVSFPLDYAEFLLQFNGGVIRHPAGFLHPKPNFENEVYIRHFIGGPVDPSDFRRFGFEPIEDPVPAEFVRIAWTHEDCILMHLRGEDEWHGTIWLYDNADFWSPNERVYLHQVADTFHQFLDLLIPLPEFAGEPEETDPVFKLVETGNIVGVRDYLALGKNCELRNASGQTLLAAAASHIWPKIVKLLIEQGADINSRDLQGRTPLHHAAVRSFDSAKLLVAAGADMKARDHEGKGVSLGPEHWREMHQYLIKHGGQE